MTKGIRRYKNKDAQCPICEGYDQMQRGNGTRCYGYGSEDGLWANCTNKSLAGGLLQKPDDTFGHKLTDNCKCGVRHNLSVEPTPKATVPSQRTIEATYDYSDENGVLLYQAIRYNPKGFSQRRPDGDTWSYNLNGVRRVPYRLPDLLAAIKKGATEIYIGEGEKVVDLLWEMGFIATCNSEGAKRWHEEFADYFVGLDVVILPDNDDVGKEHGLIVVTNLLPVAKSVKVVELPGLPDKGDVVDWMNADHTPDELRQFVSVHTIYKVNRNELFPVRTAREVGQMTPEKPDWLAVGIVARESLTEIVGKAKLAGKTTFVLKMAKAMESGTSFMGKRTRPAKILYLTEERHSTFVQALNRAGLSESDSLYVVSYYEVSQTLSWPERITTATNYAKKLDVELLVVDTLGHWAGLRGEAENHAGPALEAMLPLQYAAAQGLGVIILRHGNKSGGEVGDAGRGSSATTGSVDTSYLLTRVAAGESSANRRELKGVGRFDDTIDSLLFELVDDEYLPLGTTTDARRVDAHRLIIAHLPGNEDDAIGQSDLNERIGQQDLHSTVGRELPNMWSDGKVGRVGEGKKGDKFRYYLRTEFVSPHPISSMNRNEYDSTDIESLIAPLTPCGICQEKNWEFVATEGAWLCRTCEPEKT